MDANFITSLWFILAEILEKVKFWDKCWGERTKEKGMRESTSAGASPQLYDVS